MQNSDTNIISKISHIHSLCADFLRVELNKTGLPNLASSHGFILYLLSQNKTLTMREISQKINRDKSTTTVLIKKLESLGYIKTASSPDDSRIKLVSLTPQGISYNEATASVSERLKKNFFNSLSESEIKNLAVTLDKISENFSSIN
ncbi:MAG: MarR family transcriptional regulator [Treponema sp.]|nr:MarR family transcriptional regulator [Candidatus Treponema merdequi]